MKKKKALIQVLSKSQKVNKHFWLFIISFICLIDLITIITECLNLFLLEYQELSILTKWIVKATISEKNKDKLKHSAKFRNLRARAK